VLHAAVDSGKLVKMPDLPKLPPMPKKLPEGPSLAEIDKLVSVATGWVRTAAALAGYAGLRSGEVRALRRGDVDLVTGTIRVRRAFSENELVEEPKDGEERIIPIAPPLRPVLVEAVRDKLPGAFLVITGQGRTPTRQRVYAAIVDLQRRHELPHRSFHANRHGFLSELARRKGSIEAIRLLAGHAKLETTQRYLHATADDLRETIALLGGAPVEPPNSSAS
jgi:integrase